ncbi:MAG TPA: VOC family protein [Roseimicrobium sp.]|nr:VOC family protein [Roseimicrobium sp.]
MSTPSSQPTDGLPEIHALDHVGINVTDLTRSAEWYRRVLGFEIVHKWTTTWMVKRGNMRIGLFERKEATPVENLDQRVAITHFCFLTDAQGFIRTEVALRKLEVEVGPPEDSGIAWSLFFQDPDGHEIEITTYYATVAAEVPTDPL